jgi:hypothetical protein
MLGINIRVPSAVMIMIACIVFFLCKVFLQKEFFNYKIYPIISCDCMCSHFIKQQIYKAGEESFFMTGRTLAQKISDISPIISMCSVKRNVKGFLYVDVQAEIPSFLINDSIILTHTKRIVPKDHFIAVAFNNIPHIQIDKSINVNRARELIGSLASYLKEYIDQSYQLGINDSYFTTMNHPTDSYAIRLMSNKLPSITKIQKAEEAVKDFLIRHSKHMHNHRAIADLRFKDQLVIYKELKEARS